MLEGGRRAGYSSLPECRLKEGQLISTLSVFPLELAATIDRNWIVTEDNIAKIISARNPSWQEAADTLESSEAFGDFADGNNSNTGKHDFRNERGISLHTRIWSK